MTLVRQELVDDSDPTGFWGDLPATRPVQKLCFACDMLSARLFVRDCYLEM